MLNRNYTPPSVTRVADRLAQIRAMFAPTTFLILPVADDRNGEIFDDNDLPIQSPPYEIDVPDEINYDTPTTPAGIEYAESVSVADIAAAASNAHSLALNTEADRAERDELRDQIVQWKQEEIDASRDGQSCDLSHEIGDATNRIHELDKRLEAVDVATAVAVAPVLEAVAPTYSQQQAERRELPFWRYYAARTAESRELALDCARTGFGAKERRNQKFHLTVSCTQNQVKYIRFLAGGDDAAREVAGCNLFSLRSAEAGALIDWLKDGRPES